MAKRYSIADARASLSTLVDEVESGAEIELTRRGKPVAVLISRRLYERLRPKRSTFAERYRAFREQYGDEVGLDREFFESLRDRSVGRDVDL